MNDKPEVMWRNGRVLPWKEATVHVTSETAARGINVFEGLRAYWREADGAHAVVALDAHMRRLHTSAQLMYLPTDSLGVSIDAGVIELIRALGHRGDLYLRAVVYLEEGRYTASSDAMRVGSYVVAYPVSSSAPRPLTCAVTSWRRCPDTVLPTAAKTGAGYAALRLARIEAASRGADEPILLNEGGTVAETAGAAVFAVRHGIAYSPPASEGNLDSITRHVATRLLSETAGVPVVEQPLSRSDLLTADEVFLTGTLDEIRPVAAVDGITLPTAPGPVTQRLQDLYRDMCHGVRPPLQNDWIRLVEA